MVLLTALLLLVLTRDFSGRKKLITKQPFIQHNKCVQNNVYYGTVYNL